MQRRIRRAKASHFRIKAIFLFREHGLGSKMVASGIRNKAFVEVAPSPLKLCKVKIAFAFPVFVEPNVDNVETSAHNTHNPDIVSRLKHPSIPPELTFVLIKKVVERFVPRKNLRARKTVKASMHDSECGFTDYCCLLPPAKR